MSVFASRLSKKLTYAGSCSNVPIFGSFLRPKRFLGRRWKGENSTTAGEKYPTMVIKDVTKLTSEFTGVSDKSINAIRLEISRVRKVTSPANKKK
ncbi:hypothetical protein C0J52_01890 [Blattella germanica]|nr:hypothetical protein C0J52_01890 [Blattella germanica]